MRMNPGELLRHRTRVGCTINDAARKEHDKTIKADRRRLHKKFPATMAAMESDDNTWRSKAAERLSQWSWNRAWTQCEQCRRMVKQPLLPGDISGRGPPTRPRPWRLRGRGRRS